MVNKICTHCGYEGEAVKRPKDTAGEKDNEVSNAFDRLCRMIFLATGVPVKPVAMALVAPIYLFIIWPIKMFTGDDGRKWCPNCGLPLMVSLKSDAGWLAKRKNDIKAGAVVIESKDAPKLAFGKEVVLPGDEKKPKVVDAPRPEKLPSLDEILAPPPQEKNSLEAADAAEKHQENKPRKTPVDPETW